MRYECWAYRDGKPYKMTSVHASSKNEARILAGKEFDKLGIYFDDIKCH